MARRGRHAGGGGGGGGTFRQSGGNNGYGGSDRGAGGGGGGPHAAPPPPPPQVVTEEQHPPVKGPHPGYVSVACQYTLEQQLRQMQRDNGCDPSREDSYRLQGVQLIDNVRESLQLPVKTFSTACTYYHKFRLNFRDAEYNFQDAALSALFVACKVEDTLKKSREVLCAAYNLKNPDKPTAPDDKIFDRPSTIIVGLDRLILQTVGFDFRVRHPQKLLVKLIRQLVPAADARAFLAVAYPMSIDLYKTFAPIKQTSFTMALSVVELTARVLDNKDVADAVRGLVRDDDSNGGGGGYHTSRGCVVETLLDLLDLYTQFAKSTKVGARFDLHKFIDIKIKINQEVDDDAGLQRIESWCDKCAALDDRDAAAHAANITLTPGSVTSPATTGSWPGGIGSGGGASGGSGSGGGTAPKPNQKRLEGTMRFLFEADKMRQEQAEVAEYFKEDYVEEEIEVEEPIPEPSRSGGGGGGGSHGGQQHQQQQQHGGHSSHSSHQNNNNGSSGRGRGARRDRNNHHGSHPGGGNGDTSWGPYQRSRDSDHRHKPRKGGYY